MTTDKNKPWSPDLSAAEETTLFTIANDSLAWCVEHNQKPFDFSPYNITEKLKIPRATFVTLKINAILRGCIGSLEPSLPLYQSIHDNAVNAAMHDPRFPAVTTNELPQLDVHISILSPITTIANIDEFKLGEHGIIIQKGYHRAVFLPEVAIEQNWNVEQTLSYLSQKAGLPPEGWKSGTTFQVFSSVSIGSEDIPQ